MNQNYTYFGQIDKRDEKVDSCSPRETGVSAVRRECVSGTAVSWRGAGCGLTEADARNCQCCLLMLMLFYCFIVDRFLFLTILNEFKLVLRTNTM